MALARTLGVALSETRALIELLPVALPLRLADGDAAALLQTLRESGAQVDDEVVRSSPMGSCDGHERFDASLLCARCNAKMCTLCGANAPDEPTCAACLTKRGRSRTFFRIRVAVLLSVLVAVVAWAARDMLRRERRTDWERPVVVGLVLLHRGEVDAAATATLRTRVSALEDHLAAEFARHRPGASRPFEFALYGPASVSVGPPTVTSDDLIDVATYTYELDAYLERADELAGVPSKGLDARIYLIARPPEHAELTFVEGVSQQGGWVGLVEVELAEAMVDFALFVATHELLHTLGATDKYDENGTMIPAGLAEPDRRPRFPQRFVEIMARHRPTAPGREVPPDSLTQIRIGDVTAREIGWLK